MDLRMIRHLWGVPGDPSRQLDGWAETGYSGLEIPGMMLEASLVSAAKARDWLVVVQAYSDGWNYSHDVATHVASFKEQALKARDHGADLLNCHGGEDAFTDAQAEDFFGQCLEIARQEDIKVVWETHRGRAMFTPWRTAHICKTFPELRLCADFSHWTCVCERLINDQDDLLTSLLPAIDHIHARVGSSQAPQVGHPGDAESAPALEWFLTWWGRMWKSQAERGLAVSTVCPEFGPKPYLPSLPYTGTPVADLAQVCDWMTARLQAAFTHT